MSDGGSTKSATSHCSVKKMPFPSVLDCSACGEEVELWSDEDYAECACGQKVFRMETAVK
jgi:hypothetical protein